MNPDEHKLWQRIKDFEFDDPESSLTFTTRLARENGWSLEYSLRAVHEYKKFIFMFCLADHSLTPSDQVDQVWHLHLLYTRSYWIDFCQDLLERQIHHGPTKGGKEESDKYGNLYSRTLQLYQKLFDRKAPEDIWPPSKIRFGDVNFIRVNRDKNWIIKKPHLLK